MRFAIAGAFCAAVLSAAPGAGPGHAHEGHDHGPQAALARPDAAPRGEATSSAFEAGCDRARLEEAELVIYLDRFATNEPVQGASIEVETPEGPVPATAANGFYRLNAPWLAKPGHVDLIVTVTSDGAVDVLPLSIDIPDRACRNPGIGRMGRSGIGAVAACGRHWRQDSAWCSASH